MEKFTPPKLPTMLNGHVMLVDAEAWNSLVEYIQSLTEFTNTAVDVLNSVVSNETKDSEAIRKISEILKEHLTQ